MREVMARSFMDPIIGSYKIYCYTNDSSAFLLDMTSLFTGNSERLAPISSGGGMVEITAVFNSAGSILDGIKAFDDKVVSFLFRVGQDDGDVYCEEKRAFDGESNPYFAVVAGREDASTGE